MVSLSDYITNINRSFKNIKSKIIVDYIQLEIVKITIVSNVIAT